MRLATLALILVTLAAGCAPLPWMQPATWPLRGTAAARNDAVRSRPIVVKVANDANARPQAGLARADLVLEIPVEGGITRYALVFHSEEADRIGPVRSARQSDLHYLDTLRAIIAHVGASEAVARKIREAAGRGGFVDVDELAQAHAFERITARQAPYNAYTSTARVREAAGTRGRDRVDVPSLTFEGVVRGRVATEAAAASSLVIPYGGAQRVRYEYDAAARAYHRTQGGQRTVDGATNVEVLPENVVIIKTDVSEIAGTADVMGAPSVDFRATGSGPLVVLRDGRRYEGSWSRQGNQLYRFSDSSGATIALRPGLTWIHIVPLAFDLSGP